MTVQLVYRLGHQINVLFVKGLRLATNCPAHEFIFLYINMIIVCAYSLRSLDWGVVALHLFQQHEELHSASCSKCSRVDTTHNLRESLWNFLAGNALIAMYPFTL